MSQDLWESFTGKLQRAGYSLEDISDCSDQVFLSVISELGGFTALQTAKLQTEMKRRLRASVSRQNSRPATPVEVLANAASSVLRPGTTEYDAIFQKVSTFLNNTGVVEPIVSISKWSDQTATTAHLAHLNEMHDPHTSPILRFKWMSEDDLNQGLSSASVMDADTSIDTLCPSGIVLYSERSTSAKPRCSGLSGTRHDVLIAVDAVLGKTKLMDDTDVRLLQGFSMKDCFHSLHEDGFDSIQVLRSNGTSDAIVLLHPDQSLVRYVIRFQPEFSDEFPAASPAGHRVSLPKDEEAYFSRASSTNPTLTNRGGVSEGGATVEMAVSPMPRCATHPTKALEFWCPEEKMLLCSHCLFHSGYNKKTCLLIEDAAATEIHDLQTWTRNASTFLRDIQSVEKLFDAAVSEVEEETHVQIQDARVYFQALRKSIDTAEELIVEELSAKAREESQKMRRAASLVAKRVGEVEELHQRSCRLLSRDRLDSASCVELLSIMQRAFSRWDIVTIPGYEMCGVQTKVFPSASQVASAVTTSITKRDGTVNLPEAIDVNYLQMLK